MNGIQYVIIAMNSKVNTANILKEGIMVKTVVKRAWQK